jgi:hypothetical protein
VSEDCTQKGAFLAESHGNSGRGGGVLAEGFCGWYNWAVPFLLTTHMDFRCKGGKYYPINVRSKWGFRFFGLIMGSLDWPAELRSPLVH